MKKVLFVILSISLSISTLFGAITVSTFIGKNEPGWSDLVVQKLANVNSMVYVGGTTSSYYLADSSKIYKISSNGIISTFAGNDIAARIDGTGTVASFSYITSITSDSSGNLYVLDNDGKIYIRKITPAGIVTTIANVSFDIASFIACDKSITSSTTLYVEDNLSIKKIVLSGTTATVTEVINGSEVFNEETAETTPAKFGTIQAITAINGVLYFSDDGFKLYKLTVSTKAITEITNNTTPIENITKLVNDGTNVFTVDNGKIKQISGNSTIDIAGNSDYTVVDGTAEAASFANIQAIATTSAGILQILDSGMFRKLTVSSKTVQTQTTLTINQSEVNYSTVIPYETLNSFVMDGNGGFYASDSTKIYHISSGKKITTLTPGFTGISAMLRDNVGNLYVADVNSIKKISTDKTTVTTLAGSTTAGYIDDTFTAARFDDIAGMTMDSKGNIFVIDKGNNAIRQVTFTDSDTITVSTSTGTSTLSTIQNTTTGWYLLGSSESIKPAEIKATKSTIKIIWQYVNNAGWRAYSDDGATKTALSNMKISTIENINPGDGFWIYIP